jgi:hypothetical protein
VRHVQDRLSTDSLELACRTAQPDGVIYFACYILFLTYMELARRQPALHEKCIVILLANSKIRQFFCYSAAQG